jgi:predicted protein tyrosine phosphatase
MVVWDALPALVAVAAAVVFGAFTYTAAEAEAEHDYEEEGIKLLARLNLSNGADGAGAGNNHLDALYQHPTTGARVYVGNITAATSKAILEQHGITHVVNCRSQRTVNSHEGNAAFTYLRFPIGGWRNQTASSSSNKHLDVQLYLDPLFAFVDRATANGHNVLIHCHAGAHRAGTVGILYMMHSSGMSKADATATAQRLRPIINPMGRLATLLGKYEAALASGE